MAVMRAAAVADQSCMPAVPIPSRAAVLASVVLASTAARAQDLPEDKVTATFETLLAAYPPEDFGGRLRLCAWAQQNELIDEAEDLCRGILEQDPAHTEAYELLVQLASRRPLSRQNLST